MRLSFDSWVRLKEGLGFGMDSPEAERAVQKLMMRYHGWPQENIEAEIKKPGYAMWVTKKFGLDFHGKDTWDVVNTVCQQYGIPTPKILG